MTIGQLDALIKAICPIHGINSDGVIWFKEASTEAQREEAVIILNLNIDKLSNNL
jgi:hypothetical protein